MTTPPPGQWPPPPQGPPQGPPQWTPQQGTPPKGNGKAKWILGGLALLVVVVITVVATLLVTRESSGSTDPTASPPSTSVDTSDIASADDRGPAGIITEDPTCAAWGSINDALSVKESEGWNDRDPARSASAWTDAQRRQYEAVADGMRSAADQTTALVKLTPHRVMRELYEQSIAYWRAYADSVPQYTPPDDHLARVATSTSSALVWICSAVKYGSAAARSPAIAQAGPPLSFAQVEDPTQPKIFMKARVNVCGEWTTNSVQFQKATAEWLNVDPNLSADQWTPQQQAINADVAPVMMEDANRLQELGIQSKNPTFNDFATMAAQYRRGFVQSIPNYSPPDTYLANAAAQLVVVNDEACKAAD